MRNFLSLSLNAKRITTSPTAIVLKNLARNPTGFRRRDEWFGVLHG